MGWFWPLSSWSSTTHGHPVRSPGSVSLAIWEADHRCPVAATGLKSSLHPWIFHLWISQNRCSVFAFPDWDQHFLSPLLISPCFFGCLCACVLVCVYIFLIFLNLSLLCLPLENHNPFCHCFIFLLFLLFSLIAYFYHACTSSTSSLTMRLTFNSCFFFFFFFYLISQPTGYLNRGIYLYSFQISVSGGVQRSSGS